MSTNITLVHGEKVVMSSDRNILTLTTRRVRYDSTVVGSSAFLSITLDSVASCGLVTRSLPVLLLLAAVAVVASFISHDNQAGLVVCAAVLTLIYFLTRRSRISIASNGGDTILAPTDGMSRANIIGFLEAIESEKLSYTKCLKSD